MSTNQTVNDSVISFSTIEIGLPRIVRFWILLLFEIPSVACSIFVICYSLIDKRSRSNIKNHALIVALYFGLGVQLIDVPLYINFIEHSAVVPQNPLTCLVWLLASIGYYNGVVLTTAWIAFERHIIVFHNQWITKTKPYITVHVLPLLIIIVYVNVYYIYANFFYDCQNRFDYTLPICNIYPCYQMNNNMRMWELFVNCIIPSVLEALFSLAFIFRVIWHRFRSHLPIQWRKQRKMAIQLTLFSSLNVAFNVPSSIIYIAQLCGAPPDFGVDALQYMYFFCYWVVFLFPFICLATMNGARTMFQRMLDFRRYITVFNARITPNGPNVNIGARNK